MTEVGNDFHAMCTWLAKSAPEGVDRMQWLIKHGLITGDGQYLTRIGVRALKRSEGFAKYFMGAIGKNDEDVLRDLAEKVADICLAEGVAGGDTIRLADNRYVAVSHFDPTIHERAKDIRLLEMTRADLEALIAKGDGTTSYRWKILLSVAELIGWPEKGSPLVWLLQHGYLDRTKRGFEWTPKATRNKKLHGKLKRLPSLFSPVQKRH